MLPTHGGFDTITGRLVQTSLKHHILELGSFTSLFSLPYASHKCLTTPTWLTVLCDFFCKHNIKLSNSSSIRLSPSRLHDCSSMDVLMSGNDVIESDLISINRVR